MTGLTDSAWFAGTNVTQYGTNCSVLGTVYPEPMVSGTAFCGRAGFPAVGEQYWIGVLVSVIGNACATGIVLVTTDMELPPSTNIDTSPSRRIRCFATRRYEEIIDEVTDQRP